MSLPLFVLVTPDLRLTAEFTAGVGTAFELRTAATLPAASDQLRAAPADVLAVDLRSASGGGHVEARFLEMVSERCPEADVFVLAGADCPEPVERLCACQEYEILRGPDIAATIFLRLAPPPVHPVAVHRPPTEAETEAILTGMTRQYETRTPRVKVMLSELEIAARHDVTVLLIGETGAGKTFLSRLIHEVSPRRDEPFLPVACGALPSELIESELFGHVRGAFTSAHADKDGKFVAAGRGTILLDEIDVLGPEQQVKLLRVIESGEFEPVGSNRTMKSQARLIVASNLELQPLVQQGKFRPDLYYRLNMLKFEVSPLRARKPDIIPLAEKFIAQLSAKHGVAITRIDDSLYTALCSYPWPGNVRELENVIQRAVIYCRDGVLTAQQLPSYVLLGVAGPTNDASVNLESHDEMAPGTPGSLGRQISYTEREIIEQALAENHHSRTGTARALGISRVTLYNKMKKYGIK